MNFDQKNDQPFINPLKHALQIYGGFRTFKKYLPQILSLIGFEKYDFDIFILSERKGNYSVENEQIIRDICTVNGTCKIVSFQYFDDYPEQVKKKEDEHFRYYEKCLGEAMKTIHKNPVSNAFVTRLWYRRYLNNQMRIEHERSTGTRYRWVIRTRFDIGRNNSTKPITMNPLFEQPPQENMIHGISDTISCGSPDVINRESELILHWPFDYQTYKKNGKLPSNYYPYKDEMRNLCHIGYWLFMSEANHLNFLKHQGIVYRQFNCGFLIQRK